MQPATEWCSTRIPSRTVPRLTTTNCIMVSKRPCRSILPCVVAQGCTASCCSNRTVAAAVHTSPRHPVMLSLSNSVHSCLSTCMSCAYTTKPLPIANDVSWCSSNCPFPVRCTCPDVNRHLDAQMQRFMHLLLQFMAQSTWTMTALNLADSHVVHTGTTTGQTMT